jgi:hypothetical protein
LDSFSKASNKSRHSIPARLNFSAKQAIRQGYIPLIALQIRVERGADFGLEIGIDLQLIRNNDYKKDSQDKPPYVLSFCKLFIIKELLGK